MRRIQRWVASLAALVAATRAAAADSTENADGSTEAIAIQVDGFAGCPSGAEFWRRIAQRAPGVRLTRAGEAGRIFAVRFEQMDSRDVIGRLRIVDIEGGTLEREVNGATRAEVADALSIIAAVAARRDAHITSPTKPIPAQETPPAVQPPPSERAEARARERGASSWGILVRGEISVRTQVLPAPLYGGGLGFEVVRDGDSPWQPSIGLTFDATLGATANTDHVISNTEM